MNGTCIIHEGNMIVTGFNWHKTMSSGNELDYKLWVPEKEFLSTFQGQSCTMELIIHYASHLTWQ
jgi:hypothetical protein